jgi:hypothetical protein
MGERNMGCPFDCYEKRITLAAEEAYEFGEKGPGLLYLICV